MAFLKFNLAFVKFNLAMLKFNLAFAKFNLAFTTHSYDMLSVSSVYLWSAKDSAHSTSLLPLAIHQAQPWCAATPIAALAP